jgi:cell cycle arrest protein BUB2
MHTDRYLDIVRQGPSPSYEKIRNDTFRTLTSDPIFRRRVTENSLTRVLNAVSWKLHDANEARVNGWQSPPSIGSRPPLSFTGSPEADGTSPVALRSAADALSDAGTANTSGQDASVGYVQGMNV